MSSRVVLVTGAGGFIGSNLVRDQLRRGHVVRAYDVNLDRLSDLEQNDRCSLIVGDVRDTKELGQQLAGVDTLFHLASAHLEVSKGDDFFWSVNVHAIKDILAGAENAGVERYVHCSSVGVYGPIESLPADEASPCHPDILYEQTKLAGEEAVRLFMETSDMHWVILRPAWVYGPGCMRTLKLIRTIDKGRFVIVGDGTNLRHPIYVQDMCDAFELAAVGENIDGETFVIAADEFVELQQLVREITVALGRKTGIPRVPFWLIQPLCWFMDGVARFVNIEPPFSSRSLKFFSESSAFKIDHAKSKLGFRPRYNLAEGLSETLNYYRERKLL